MAYVPLDLRATDDRVNAAICQFTEKYLEQAHHLLSRVFGRNSPHETFALSVVVMTLLAVASASSVRHFDPMIGKKEKISDSKAFCDFVNAYFPWDCVGVKDDQCRQENVRREVAAKDLYREFRCPLIHAGGVVGPGKRTVRVRNVFPGLSDQENEDRIEKICRMPTLDGQTMIELTANATTVHTMELYWSARQAIERFSADKSAEADIRENLIRNNR